MEYHFLVKGELFQKCVGPKMGTAPQSMAILKRESMIFLIFFEP